LEEGGVNKMTNTNEDNLEEHQIKNTDNNSSKNSKIKTWLKNPYNIALIAILLFAFGLRLYYFFLTLNQPLWWDEAEYGLRAKAFAFGTPITGWAPERELIVPLFFSIFLKLGLGEIALRFIQVLVSSATVFMTYLLVSKISNKQIALYATFGMAFFWLHIFFTERILLYLWAPLMYLLIVYFFYTGFLHENKKPFDYLCSSCFNRGSDIYLDYVSAYRAILLFIYNRRIFYSEKQKGMDCFGNFYSCLAALYGLFAINIWLPYT
jgi:hypothetical protein